MTRDPFHAVNGDDHHDKHSGESVNASNVVPLRRVSQHEPGAPLDGHGEDAVIEGELVPVDEESESALVEQRSRVRHAVARRIAAPSTELVRKVRSSPRTVATTKAAARHSATTVVGFKSWATRAWDAATMGVYRRQIKAAEACGNQEVLAEWTDRKQQAAGQRRQRVMELPSMLASIAMTTLAGLAAIAGGLLTLAGVAHVTGVAEFTTVLGAVVGVIRLVVQAIALVWLPVLALSPVFLAFAAWREGTRQSGTSGWMATNTDAVQDVVIDERVITRALEALRIAAITDYLKQGLPLQFLTPARLDGRGTHAVVRLPAGVTAETIARKRGELATGLHRLPKEVWPTTGAEAGILDLWVADKNALAEGAGNYPLLSEGTVDVFEGVPFGKTLRGQPLLAPVMERNTLTGGMPGQGKSSAARVIMTGAALDPTCELRIWVPDANFDFEAFRPRCSRYVMGAEDDRIEEILADLQDLHAEVQRRGQLLIRHEAPSVTRQLANKNLGLHPLICLLEEAHVAIQHPHHGKAISKLLVDTVRLGRKRGIHLLVSTQAPTKDSMPRDVTRNCSNGIAFAVGDHVANDALLGQGAYRAGHRATELIPGADKGTAIVKGFTGERSEAAQAYFLDISRENDQITPLITRAVEAMRSHGHGNPASAPAEQDLLADLDAVMGHEPVPAADVPALLARHAPDWAPYRRMSGKKLRARLRDEHNITVASTGNRFPVDPAVIRSELVRRDAETADESDEQNGDV